VSYTAIAERLQQVRARISAAEQAHQRRPGSVSLLAVSKTQSVASVREAIAAGQHAFGENYVQDGQIKIDALAGCGVEWHFIGPIQSNKTRTIATHYDWVHSLDRERIALRLSEQRPPGLPPLNVCIQVQLSDGPERAGVDPAAVAALAERIQELPGLRLRGLMGLPDPLPDFTVQRAPFRRLRAIRDQLQAQGFELDTLSMGMSGDLEAAIAEGSTMVRVGTDVFGPRVPRESQPAATPGSPAPTAGHHD